MLTWFNKLFKPIGAFFAKAWNTVRNFFIGESQAAANSQTMIENITMQEPKPVIVEPATKVNEPTKPFGFNELPAGVLRESILARNHRQFVTINGAQVLMP